MAAATSFHGATILITGASMGIGENLAYEAAAQGSRLLLTARSKDLLEKVCNECLKRGAISADFIVADMAVTEDIKAVAEKAKQLFEGKLSLLILNHKGSQDVFLWKGTESELNYLEKTMSIDFVSYVRLATYTLPMLELDQGRVVAVSSMAGELLLPTMAAYSAAKAAIYAFFHALRKDLHLRKSQVSITICLLGAIDTPGYHQDMGQGMFYHYSRLSSQLASPQSAAKAILQSALNREIQMWYPWFLHRVISYLRGLPWGREILDFITLKTMALANS